MLEGNIPVETIRPRTWQQKPGDRLILVPDAEEWMRRVGEFEELLGEAQAEFIYTIPFLAAALYERHPEGPAGIPLQVAWHPLFWLPTKLASPLLEESDAEWGYRVCRAFLEHGVYVPEDGTWMDIPAWLGLNIDHPTDRARIQTWLAGNPDPLLDRIDWDTIGGLYPPTPETEHLTYVDAITGVPTYEEAQFALTAHSLFQAVTEELEGLTDSDAEAKAIEVFDKLAPTVLRTLAAAPEAIEGWGTVFDSVEPISAALHEPGADKVELLGDLVSQIVTIHDTHVASLKKVLEEEGEQYANREQGLALETLQDSP